MSGEIEMSLHDLVLVALGSPKFDPINVKLLHSIFNVLLKKLGCLHETVSIGGMESKCWKKKLKETVKSPVYLGDENVEILSNKWNKMDFLELEVDRVRKRLEDHFDAIRECNEINGPIFNTSHWRKYMTLTEDLDTHYEPENELAYTMLHSTDFLKILMRNISIPAVQRIYKLQEKIDKLHKTFLEFIGGVTESTKKQGEVKNIGDELERIRRTIDENFTKFVNTMEEVQAMLDAKLHKAHLPALKKYLNEQFDCLESRLHKIIASRKCKATVEMPKKGLICLSCGLREEDLPSCSIKKVTKPCAPTKSNVCPCRQVIEEPQLLQRINNLELNSIALMLKSNEDRKSCKDFGSIRYTTGVDGKLFRLN